MATDWQDIRSEFPALEDWTYLNSATYGQTPRRAIAALNEHMVRRNRLACTDFMQWFDDMDRLRGLVGRLINCAGPDVAFIPNASTALAMLVRGLHWRSGDRVVTLANEFPNQLYAPAIIPGVELVQTEWQCFYDALTPRTRLVALSQVNYSTGFRPPLEEIAPELRRRGILLYVDGTQATGALRFDVAAIQPDMFAVDAYKWMLTPNGAGFAYVNPELRKLIAPVVVGWRSHKDWRRPEELHHGVPEFSAGAERYEGGMLAFPVLYALRSVIGLLLAIGPEIAERRALEMAEGVRAILRKKGARLAFDESPYYDSPIVCAEFPDRDPVSLVRLMATRKVIVAARQGRLRVSPHFYNNELDLAAFETAF